MYCCESFASLVNNAGRRGLSALPRNELGLKYFCIQGRACDIEEITELQVLVREGLITLPFNLTLITQTGIKYCPFCGYNLGKWIRKHEKFFEETAEELKQFLES